MSEEMKPPTDEMFIASTRLAHGGTVEDFVKALDDTGYWGDASLSIFEKRQHVLHKLETLTEPERHSTDEVVEWIKTNYPGVSAGTMPEGALASLAVKAHAEQWHPDQVAEALDRLSDESMDLGVVA